MMKSKNRAIQYFFLISVIFHAVLLFYLGRSIITRRSGRRIEVDLKSTASTRPIRSIPQPYRRPRAVPKTQQIKAPIKSSAPKPILSHVPVKTLKPEKTFSPQVVEHIHSPLAASHAQPALGVVGQIRAVEIPQIPSAIKVASDTFDQTLAYQGMIRQRIEEHKHFPPLAVKRGLEGRVGLRFLLYRDGHVEQVTVTRSSHLSLLDEAAVRAVKAGNPYPPFPESIPQDSMTIEVTLSFELRRRVH